jgi:hypothetical protein
MQHDPSFSDKEYLVKTVNFKGKAASVCMQQVCAEVWI